jgi:CubicO group peptidase (beta-lactamase class C family)
LAVLRVWRRPLPEILKEYIMDPVGASSTWEWHGYRNSEVVVGDRPVQSVSGGGHWGGGLFISSRDHARFGYLLLRNGNWNGKQLLPEAWIRQAVTPSEQNPEYGYMFWLNTGKTLSPSAPESSFFARGAGSNVVWIDPENDIVAVFRWILKEKIDELCGRILKALR